MNARLILSAILFSFLALGWVGACVMLRAAEVGELVMPLEDRKFDALEVVTVGTGGPYENPERLGPVTAIGWDTHVLLVDAGRGTAEALRRSGIPVSQPRTILLTNLLPYNTMGLDDLLFTGWLVGREQGIQLIGPPGTRQFAKNLLAAHRAGSDAHGRSLNLPSEAIQLDVIEAGDGWSEERDGLEIRAGELRGGPTPGLAWRFERDGKSVLVAGMGWDSDTLVSPGLGRGYSGSRSRLCPAAGRHRRCRCHCGSGPFTKRGRFAHVNPRHRRTGVPRTSRDPGAGTDAAAAFL